MKINKGFLKIKHGFRYSADAPFEVKAAVMEQELREIKAKGYDGIVSNVDFTEGYLENEENWRLMEEKARLCEELGLRLWIYDENAYPSGAAGVLTLKTNPDLEALALAAVHKVLAPGESALIPLPHGHEKAVAAFGFYFRGDRVREEDLDQTPLSVPLREDGFSFENHSDRKLLCLGFFTKRAFEGTHCQHNAASERRYIDIGNPDAGKIFIENTYKPYYRRLEKYFQNGVIEAFFADEPSYMAVYFNLKKKPREVTHLTDPQIPLYAMVNWSRDLPAEFEKEYGYRLEDQLPWLFMGSSARAQKVRRDYYLLLTRLAQNAFFKPIADFCEAHGTRSSGHILLEERITDHPYYQGSFFPLLSSMHVPGMDMLDSLPERVWKKSFTPLLLRSISQLYRDGSVMDEVSAYFQNKFKIEVDSQRLFTSLVLQYIFGATLFVSYYNDEEEAILARTPGGESTLIAFKRVMASTDDRPIPAVALHYPIEAVMSNTVSPVDVATVYNSVLDEFKIPYPIRREDLDKQLTLTPLVEDPSADKGKSIEKSMESCMFSLLDRQIDFLFTDSATLSRFTPEVFVTYADALDEDLLPKLAELHQKGCKIYVAAGEKTLPELPFLTPIPSSEELGKLLQASGYSQSSGDTQGVAALWNRDKVLLANSDNREKTITLNDSIRALKDCYGDADLPLRDPHKITLPPYGVYLAEF